ncbi:MAG: GNAT family N-acetyltransferase [Thermodesulfobacteriota bacterium]
MDSSKLSYRETPTPADIEAVRSIVSSSGFFSESEIEVAVELVEERLSKGLPSGYHFLFAEDGKRMLGYACYGPIPCTSASWDLYWIAVQPELRGRGTGRRILELVERKIGKMGGKRVYVDTSSREIYRPTLAFYARCGYRQEAVLKDFYAPGDNKVLFLKVLEP